MINILFKGNKSVNNWIRFSQESIIVMASRVFNPITVEYRHVHKSVITNAQMTFLVKPNGRCADLAIYQVFSVSNFLEKVLFSLFF